MSAHENGRSRARTRRTTGRRTAAVLALLAAVWTALLGFTVAVGHFPRGLLVLLCAVLVAAGSWEGVLRRGWGRVAGLAVAGAALAVFGWQLADEGFLRDLLLLGLGALIWHAGARLAFRAAVQLPKAEPPRRPVVFINPRSGDGKAARFRLADEARERGIEPIELRAGDDLEALVRTAVGDGADAVAMAGGDGSQGVAAAVAASCDVPYACIPSGTRNHFALDLGVDRDDVVGALDAFVHGGERVVDLGEVNGRVFVNNVSLGVYAEAVQRTGYRAAKMRTILETVPDILGRRDGSVLTWTTPGGRTLQGAAVILVGNNQYRLSGAAGAGTRPSVDQALLGITIVDPPGTRGNRRRRPLRQWSTAEFQVAAAEQIPVGIDGEAAVLPSPVHFRIRPAALRVRIAAQHPGTSPSAIEPVGALAALRALARIAVGRDPRPAPRGVPEPAAGGDLPPLTTLRARRSGGRRMTDDGRALPGARFDDLRAGTALRCPPSSRILVARTVDDVVPLLAELEWATAAGTWAFGYLGYEAAAGLDAALPVHPGDPAGPPMAWFGLCAPPTAVPPVAAAPGTSLDWRPDWTDAAHRRAVDRVRAHIAAGDTYQVNLTDRLRASGAVDPAGLYAALAQAQGGAHNAYLDMGSHVIASASPELFFDWDGDLLRTRPMKGTAARGRTPDDDRRQGERLRASPKEQAENLMIVDLLRNDLSRVARVGSVDVPGLFVLERYPTVWQLTSEITARTRPDVGLTDVFRALFPCGSVTGAPKRASMQVIRDLETGPRGVYCGAIGLIAPPGAPFRARFSVAIRTAVVDRWADSAVYGVGGGITWGSDAAAERAELLAKTAILRAAGAVEPSL